MGTKGSAARSSDVDVDKLTNQKYQEWIEDQLTFLISLGVLRDIIDQIYALPMLTNHILLL